MSNVHYIYGSSNLTKLPLALRVGFLGFSKGWHPRPSLPHAGLRMPGSLSSCTGNVINLAYFNILSPRFLPLALWLSRAHTLSLSLSLCCGWSAKKFQNLRARFRFVVHRGSTLHNRFVKRD